MLLLLPALALAALLLVYPLYLVLDTSLRSITILSPAALSTSRVTAANFDHLLHDPQLGTSLGVTAVYTSATTALSFVVGLLLALLLNKKFVFRGLFRKLLLLPWAVPPVVAGYLFLWLFNASYGVIDYLLAQLHISHIPWLASTHWSLPGIVLATSWEFYPLFCLMILSALQVIPIDYYEAAHLDGAGAWQRFRFVTWPAIRAVSYFVSVLGAFGIFGEFAVIYTMTDGGPGASTETLGVYIYNLAFQLFQIGYGSALGLAVFVVCVVAVLIAYPRFKRTLWRA
jgi:multiple sugar transport system permease protein